MIFKPSAYLSVVVAGCLSAVAAIPQDPAVVTITATAVEATTVVATPVPTFAANRTRTLCIVGPTATWATPIPITRTAVPTDVPFPTNGTVTVIVPTPAGTPVTVVYNGTAVAVPYNGTEPIPAPTAIATAVGGDYPFPNATFPNVTFAGNATEVIVTATYIPHATVDPAGTTTIFIPLPSVNEGNGTWCDYVEYNGTAIAPVGTSNATVNGTVNPQAQQLNTNETNGVTKGIASAILMSFAAGVIGTLASFA